MFEEQTRWTLDVLKNKMLTTKLGMKYYWPNVRVTGHGRVIPDTEIMNYPVQGTATAEIIPIVVVLCWHLLGNFSLKMVSTVHDSIAFEVPPEEVEEMKPLVGWAFTLGCYEMLEKLYNYKMRVPLACEIKVGDRMGTGESSKCKAFPNKEIVWD